MWISPILSAGDRCPRNTKDAAGDHREGDGCQLRSNAKQRLERIFGLGSCLPPTSSEWAQDVGVSPFRQ